MFGGALDGLAKRLGLRPAQLTAAQRAQPATRRVGLLGALAGVVAGCSLGLLNLFLVDTRQSSDLKARHFAEAGAADRHAFQIEADNAAASDATTLVVEGPDLPGLLASLSAALSASIATETASLAAATLSVPMSSAPICRRWRAGSSWSALSNATSPA